jgi:AraC-like DNA-binding protein
MPDPSTTLPPESTETARDRQIVERFSESRLFKDYRQAFERAPGLPLTLRPLGAYEGATGQYGGSDNPFCALMGRSNHGCAACQALQARLEEEAGLEPRTLKCFAGLCDSAVPIRVGDRLIAFLQTGQILLHQPNKEEFSRTTQQLLAWGAQVNLKALEEAYFQTRVLDRTQYEAMVSLLATFAEHLATISNSIAVGENTEDPQLVARAKKYIKSRFNEPLSLEEAATAVNASTRHFCKVFKQATGLTFTDYLARVRVEKAKNLLANPHGSHQRSRLRHRLRVHLPVQPHLQAGHRRDTDAVSCGNEG